MYYKPLLYTSPNKRIPEIFSHEDISHILNTIEKSSHYINNDWGLWMKARDKCLMMTMYHLALRPKETCCLRFDDFNEKTYSFKIRGENNKVKRDRWIPLPKSLIPHLKEYLSFPRMRYWKGSPFLFPSMESNHISPDRWKGIFREILKEAGIWKPPIHHTKSPFSSYTLRHSKASHVFQKTKNIKIVADMLGHADIRSTLIYIHTDQEYQETIREAMG